MNTTPKFFRFMLVALPVGLVVGGCISFGFYFAKKEEKAGMNAGSMLARPVDAEGLEVYVRRFSETIGPRHLGVPKKLEAAAKYVESTLGANTGYAVERNSYVAAGEEVSNLEVEIPGGAKGEEIVIVGAHYDSVPGSPGADDNASGVAGLLALARAMVGKKPERTLRFVAFVNEEPPYFQTPSMGSRVYAKRCRERGERVVAMLSLESIGYYKEEKGSQKFPEPLGSLYPDTGNFIAFVGNLDSKELLERVVGLFQHHSEFPSVGDALPGVIPGVGWSDQWSFWEEGIPAVMVTGTAPYRNPNYHKATDLAATLDFEKMAEVVEGLEEMVWDLANPTDAPNTNYKSLAVEKLRGG